MIWKLAGYDDLFAYDAKYHKKCFSTYLSERNVAAHMNRLNSTRKPSQTVEAQVLFQDSDTSRSDSDIEIPMNTADTETQILHRAAEILKKHMHSFNPDHSDFPLPHDINEAEFEKQVPEVLLRFVTWLIDDDAYSNASTDLGSKAAIPCNIIMGLFKKQFRRNYFQFGLGLFIHHLVRSKTLLDLLSSMGISCNYNDVRQLTTALAKQNILNNDIYIPAGIKQVDESKKNYIQASIDNFDLNEETIDGKNTTHCMAMVIFQQKSETLNVSGHLPKESCYSLNVEDLDFTFQNILEFRKPGNRPEPSRLVPISLSRDSDDFARKSNLAWRLLRYQAKNQPFMNWTYFNNTLSENEMPVSDIFYMPFLNNPPTDYDTIFTSMVRLVQVAKVLKQNHIIITADLAIYSKAREILWSNPSDLQGKVTLKLGGMHLNMAFIASIGYIFGEGGLFTLLTETDVYAENTCRMMLEGKHYSRAIRGLSLAADALSRLFFESLMKWYQPDEVQVFLTPALSTAIDDFQKDIGSCTKTKVDDFFRNIPFIQSVQSDFIKTGCASSMTFKYWYSFLEAIDLLWRLLRAEREGDFQAHLCAVYDTLPYLSAAGRNLYLKWIPVYLSDIEELKVETPEMYSFLADGNFVVKKTNDKKFNSVATDMALEQSINKDCKSFSGIIGFSQRPGSLLRWMTTRHTLGAYSKSFWGEYLSL